MLSTSLPPTANHVADFSRSTEQRAYLPNRPARHAVDNDELGVHNMAGLLPASPR